MKEYIKFTRSGIVKSDSDGKNAKQITLNDFGKQNKYSKKFTEYDKKEPVSALGKNAVKGIENQIKNNNDTSDSQDDSISQKLAESAVSNTTDTLLDVANMIVKKTNISKNKVSHFANKATQLSSKHSYSVNSKTVSNPKLKAPKSQVFSYKKDSISSPSAQASQSFKYIPTQAINMKGNEIREAPIKYQKQLKKALKRNAQYSKATAKTASTVGKSSAKLLSNPNALLVVLIIAGVIFLMVSCNSNMSNGSITNIYIMREAVVSDATSQEIIDYVAELDANFTKSVNDEVEWLYSRQIYDKVSIYGSLMGKTNPKEIACLMLASNWDTFDEVAKAKIRKWHAALNTYVVDERLVELENADGSVKTIKTATVEIYTYSVLQRKQLIKTMFTDAEYEDLLFYLGTLDNEQSSNNKYIWPLPASYKYISSDFGERVNPITDEFEMHPAIDIPAPEGTEIYAAADGEIVTAGRVGSFGNLVVILHSDGQKTYYAHCSKIDVSVNDKVSQGDVIARVGSTGNSTGPHVHFSVYDVDGKPLNPNSFFDDKGG